MPSDGTAGQGQVLDIGGKSEVHGGVDRVGAFVEALDNGVEARID